tara:strand:- start:1219 stop:1359 length:141 start_codon:yes stop_codon:yes gene_type:complete
MTTEKNKTPTYRITLEEVLKNYPHISKWGKEVVKEKISRDIKKLKK